MLELFDGLREINMVSILLRLVMAMVFGGVVGMERGRKRRAAGFRTYMVVCVGAALTMILGQYLAQMLSVRWQHVTATVDVVRFGAQVINGIGFLGAGTIIVTGRQEVKGLTTAACLWASACMGLAIGAGFYECVMLGLVLIVLCVWLLPKVEHILVERSKNINIYVELVSLDHIGEVISCLKAQDVRIYDVDIEWGKKEMALNPSAVFTLRMNTRRPHSALLAAISEVEGIRLIEEV